MNAGAARFVTKPFGQKVLRVCTIDTHAHTYTKPRSIGWEPLRWMRLFVRFWCERARAHYANMFIFQTQTHTHTLALTSTVQRDQSSTHSHARNPFTITYMVRLCAFAFSYF